MDEEIRSDVSIARDGLELVDDLVQYVDALQLEVAT